MTRIAAAVLTVALMALVAHGCGEEDAETDGGDRPAAEAVPRSAVHELDERPLALPVMGESAATAGAECLRGDRAVGAIALPGLRKEAALGPAASQEALEKGPVYVALIAGPPRIVLLSSAERLRGSSPPWAIKTVVLSRPEYEGPVLVRGGRLDGLPDSLRFGSDVDAERALELPEGGWPTDGVPLLEAGLEAGWRAMAVTTRLAGAGCYAFQVDGNDFSYVLPFAVLPG